MVPPVLESCVRQKELLVVEELGQSPDDLKNMTNAAVDALLFKKAHRHIEDIVNQLEKVIRKNPNITIVWLSSGAARLNYTRECPGPIPDKLNALPKDLPDIYPGFNIDGDVQDLYMQTLRKRFIRPEPPSHGISNSSFSNNSIPVSNIVYPKAMLTLDMQMVQREMRHCLRDLRHYLITSKYSPYHQQWQFLYNILSESNSLNG